MNTNETTYTGNDIVKILKRQYTKDSKHVYQHMLNACKDQLLLPYLLLKVIKEDGITSISLIDTRTNELIK